MNLLYVFSLDDNPDWNDRRTAKYWKFTTINNNGDERLLDDRSTA